MVDVINFLGEIFDTGVSYSAVGTARSALSTFLWLEGKPAGVHPLVCHFLRGVFAERPALPRYEVTWDVSKVFEVLRLMHPPESLSLKDLTCKLQGWKSSSDSRISAVPMGFGIISKINTTPLRHFDGGV